MTVSQPPVGFFGMCQHRLCTTFEQGVACFTSPEYDKAAVFRRSGAGEVETIMVEGV